MMAMELGATPKAFVWRRLHSLVGVFLVLFLCEHLLTNSQAALLIGDDGHGFVRMVNFIHSLPYLPVIEVVLLGVPLVIHAVWGVRYLLTSRPNSYPSDGSKPSLREYPRNHFFTWQRITSWLLLVGIVAHVVQMRFIHYPAHADLDGAQHYLVRISMDDGLYTVAHRLGVQIMDQQMIRDEDKEMRTNDQFWNTAGLFDFKWTTAQLGLYDLDKQEELIEKQRGEEKRKWIEALKKKPLREGEVIAVANTPGTAMLLTVRDTFKSIWMAALYSFYVLAACFHACNGFWTACVSWGATLTRASQNLMRLVTSALMAALCFLGLAAIWGTYWINLTH